MITPPPKPSVLTKDWRDWADRLVQWIVENLAREAGMVVTPKYPVADLPRAVGYGMVLVQGATSVYPAYSDGTNWRKCSDDSIIV